MDGYEPLCMQMLETESTAILLAQATSSAHQPILYIKEFLPNQAHSYSLGIWNTEAELLTGERLGKKSKHTNKASLLSNCHVKVISPRSEVTT